MIVLLIMLGIWPVFLCGDANTSSTKNWTSLYRKTFISEISAPITHKNTLFFTQGNVPLFTQLVFSWNAFRPKKGYFSFYVQVRDAATKKWGAWHHMVDWGKGIQQSYSSKDDGFSFHAHVRHEINDKKASDGFRVKIESQNRALLSLIQNVFVAASNFNNFRAESDKFIDGALSSICLSGITPVAQFSINHEDKGRICSPVSCSMVVHYLTGTYRDPRDFATGAFDTGLSVYGSWGCNMAHAFESAHGKFNFFVRRMNSFEELHQQLIQRMPVVVSVRGVLPGAFKSFPHGHLMVIIGWDNVTREVLCHDPACDETEMVFRRYPIRDFLHAWERSHRLVYVSELVTK